MLDKINKNRLFLILLVLLNLGIGLIVLPGFGESVDEISQHDYAERTIEAIKTFLLTGTFSDGLLNETAKQGSHGPIFISVVTFLGNLQKFGTNALARLNFNHLCYFLVFIIGVIAFYSLSRRWLTPPAAAGITLLYNSQPLFLGHAFINPKDVVFMSFFTTSLALGLWMLDRINQGNSINKPLKLILASFTSWEVWLAAFVLGFSSAIRIAAPLVGLILIVHSLITRKWETLPRLLVYGILAAGFMFIFWPYLWPDPINRFIESLINSAKYPDMHLTLYKGVILNADSLPVSYVPTLLLIQITEPIILLAGLGLFPLLKKTWGMASVLFVWFVLPVALIMITQPHLYNNLRQIYFLYPPLFLLAGAGLDFLLQFIKRPAFRYALVGLLLIPGIYANISLYPYQYVYYNSLIGGVQGAYRNFELDYWRLAYKDAQLYVNKVAGPDANIYVDESKNIAIPYARRDLVFNLFGRKDLDRYDFIIVSTAQNGDIGYSKFKTIYTVSRNGVPLAYVKTPGDK